MNEYYRQKIAQARNAEERKIYENGRKKMNRIRSQGKFWAIVSDSTRNRFQPTPEQRKHAANSMRYSILANKYVHRMFKVPEGSPEEKAIIALANTYRTKSTNAMRQALPGQNMRHYGYRMFGAPFTRSWQSDQFERMREAVRLANAFKKLHHKTVAKRKAELRPFFERAAKIARNRALVRPHTIVHVGRNTIEYPEGENFGKVLQKYH